MLWIITQNTKVLVNVKEVRAVDNVVEGIVNRSIFIFWNKVLGEYNSSERATEIINEIYISLGKCKNGIPTFTMPDE